MKTCRQEAVIKHSGFSAICKLSSRWQGQLEGIVSQPCNRQRFLPPSVKKTDDIQIRNPHLLHTQTRMNIIFRHVGSIRPLKNKLYSDEIRRNLCTHSRYYEVVFSKGEKFYSDSLFSSSGKGINNSNGDICLFFNILTYDGTDYRFLENLPEVLSFLGEIDSKGDAVFWAYLNGYYFIFGDPASGIKQTSDGFLIYAYKLVKMCTPVQIDKFWLKIDKTGKIEVLGEKLFSRIENGCI
ncbi:MAG: hypothetical protein BWZ11_01591 [Bacteroidetes bacterium ADurb.BinA395]|nr:MAG: hypothetical protein BWZ11_01591 [Bacteroidetes bacterium ADurb.BinA395]HRT79126.1 hypothetical protein [Paludibacteraceae bacterium]